MVVLNWVSWGERAVSYPAAISHLTSCKSSEASPACFDYQSQGIHFEWLKNGSHLVLSPGSEAQLEDSEK
jgi:hypothetical protein